MLRALLARAARRLRSERDRADDGDRSTAESEGGMSSGSRFVPSVLDWSVRYGHGGADAEADRELARISEEAERLETRTREE